MDTLYPELKDYIFHYCGEFMTEDEKEASRTALCMAQAGSDGMRSMMRKKGWISDKPVILAMVADGGEALKERIVNRIWEEHRHELSLNMCPVCNKIARTPKAKQCQFCYHDWH